MTGKSTSVGGDSSHELHESVFVVLDGPATSSTKIFFSNVIEFRAIFLVRFDFSPNSMLNVSDFN